MLYLAAESFAYLCGTANANDPKGKVTRVCGDPSPQSIVAVIASRPGSVNVPLKMIELLAALAKVTWDETLRGTPG